MCTPVGVDLSNDSSPLNLSLGNIKVVVANTSDDSTRLERYRDAEKILYNHVLPVMCCFGILGNILNLVILSRKSLTIHMERLEKCAHGHLIALAVADLMYCITALPRTAMASYVHASYISPWLLYYTYHGAVINTFLLCSSWLTVAMAVSRYIAICYPMKARQHLGITSTRMVIAGIFIMSVLFNIPRYYMKTIHSMACKEGGLSYFALNGPLRTNHRAENTYLWIYFVVGIMFPLITVVYCNVYFIRALQASRKLRRNSFAVTTKLSTSSSPSSSSSNTPNILTLTLSIIVVLYSLLVTPAEIIQFFRSTVLKHFYGNDAVQTYYDLATAVCNNLQVLNFAVNFLLYCMINVHFRKVITNVLCCWRSAQPQQVWKIPFGERSTMLTTNCAVTVNL